MSDITIRALQTADELEAAVDLQKVYWGHQMTDLVPYHMLLSIMKYGGHVYGALDGDVLVGMLLGFLGAELLPQGHEPAPQRLFVMSKRLVVLPEYRGRKIGERLKRAQRDFARRHSIPLVRWTFNPLLARNAYLNLHKLRAVGQQYEEDYFGQGVTHETLRADRLVTNWWVNHPHVEHPPVYHPAQYPVANTVSLTSHGYLEPSQVETVSSPIVRLEIPSEFEPIVRNQPTLAAQWRLHVRQAMPALLQRGYVAVDFVRLENRAFYVFSRNTQGYQFTD